MLKLQLMRSNLVDSGFPSCPLTAAFRLFPVLPHYVFRGGSSGNPRPFGTDYLLLHQHKWPQATDTVAPYIIGFLAFRIWFRNCVTIRLNDPHNSIGLCCLGILLLLHIIPKSIILWGNYTSIKYLVSLWYLISKIYK